MATKGNIGTAEMARQVELTLKGQEAKREARHAKRRQTVTAKSAVVSADHPMNEAPLHALFSATRKILAANYVSLDPARVLRHSSEMKKAMALCGYEYCLRRVYDACLKSGVPEQEAAKFATSACSM